MSGRCACVGGNRITVMCCFISVGTSNYKKKKAYVCQNRVNGIVIFLLSQYVSAYESFSGSVLVTPFNL